MNEFVGGVLYVGEVRDWTKVKETYESPDDDGSGGWPFELVSEELDEGGAGSIKETKSYGKRKKVYKAKGSLTAAARELATPEGVLQAKAKAFVGYAKMEAGVEKRVVGIMNQYDAGKIDIGQLEWGLKKELGVAYRDAYSLGQQSVGFSGDLMDEDMAFIRSFKRTENKFLGNFMKAIATDKLVMEKYRRLDMYVKTIRSVFDHARVEAAPDWIKIYWTPSRGSQHCTDCMYLAINSPYTKETLPTTPRAGDTLCVSRCACRLMLRYKKPKEGAEGPEPEEELPGEKPPGEEYLVHPDLYDKFKGDVPEFRYFMDKNIGNPIAARKEFVAAVNKAGVGFAPSNYEDPFNSKFFKSNKLWIDIQNIKGIESNLPFDSPEGILTRKKRQALMQDLFNANKELKKSGLRWIRPDGYGGYSVGMDGSPVTLMPKG